MAKWYWPTPGYSTITSGVGPRWGREHKGLDIGAPMGATVIASRAGKVTAVYTSCDHNYGKSNATDPSGCGGGFGNYIFIDHLDGYVTKYAHLTSVSVRVGDNVVDRQEIGTVGSTGNSTGPHLHFQMELNGSVVDPENYVSYDDSIEVVEGNTYSPYTAEGVETVVDWSSFNLNPEFIIGERVSNVTKQPMHAYANIYIGEKLITTKPNILQSFEIRRLTGAGDTATFSLFDDTWGELEKDFANNWDNIYLEYGYADSNAKSKRHYMKLGDYSISFNSTGVLMSVQAMTHNTTKNLTQTTIPTYTRNPTDAVKAISNHMGWIVIEENFDATEDIVDMANPFTVLNDFPISYIKHSIIPYAKTKDGEIMEFHLTDDNIVYFKADSFEVPESPSLNEVRTYIYMKGYDSPIKELSFNIKGVFGGTTSFSVATGESSSVFDPISKEEISSKEDTSSVITTATGEITHTNPNQSIPTIDSAGSSPTQMKNRLYYDVKRATDSQYEADMVIIGDPTINLLDPIRIINVTDQGYLHHTSGIYKVEKITDSIDEGVMLTSLHLIRNGTGKIEDEGGLLVISPKVLVK